ncbi:MAG TPA: glycoside hydrolase family 44 protein [Polyangia bacterium]
MGDMDIVRILSLSLVVLWGCASSAQPSVDAGSIPSAGDVAASDATAVPLRKATVTIDGTTPKAVAPTFFGQNYWSWVVAWGAPVGGVQDATKDLGVRLLRAGGANNDKQSPEPFSLTEIDGFVAYARAIGAEPLLQVPMIKNSSGAAPVAQDAADLVIYVNKTKSYGVRYFSIGNEPDLYVDQKVMATGYDAKAFCQTFMSYAEAMKAIDPSIKIVGPDLSWKYQSGANDWLTPFLQDCGSFVDIVAAHRYPIDPAQCTAERAYADDANYRQTLAHLRAIMADTGQAAKPLAITEANVTWDGDPAKSTLSASPGTFPAALWLADNLGVSLESQLFNVSYWSLSEGWTLGFFNGTKPRPVYYAYQLFARRFGEQVLSTLGAPSGVSVYAGRASSPARTTVFVINKSDGPVELTLTLAGLPISTAPVLNVEAISMLVADLPDDGGATTLTRFGATTSTPVMQ